MKKLSKLLILSLSALTCFTACGNTSSSEEVPPSSSETPIVSSEKVVDVDALLSNAADFLWQTYKDVNNTEVIASVALSDSVYIDREKVSVSWKFELKEGTAPEGSIAMKDGKLVIDYFGALITNKTQTFKCELTPTLSYGEVSKGLGDAMGKTERNVIKFEVPPITVGDHDDWVKLAKDSKTRISLEGTVVDMIDLSSSSSSKGSFYMIDDDGHGYYVYAPIQPGTPAKTGDRVLVSGFRSDYSGQEEFAKGAAYGILSSGNTASLKFKDATANWAAAKSSSSSDPVFGTRFETKTLVHSDLTITADGGIQKTEVESTNANYSVKPVVTIDTNGVYQFTKSGSTYFSFHKGNATQKDSIKVTAPEGYTIGSVELVTSGTYDNLDWYVAGKKIKETTAEDSNKNLVSTGIVNDTEVLIENASNYYVNGISIKVSLVDATINYQNNLVELKGCAPQSISGSYYYFTVGGSQTEYNIYDTNYFLSEAQRNTFKATWDDAWNEGKTVTVKGISTVYSSKYQVYGSTLAPEIITVDGELTTDEKHAYVEKLLKGAIAETYKEDVTITLPTLPEYATVAYELTSPTEGATIALETKEGVTTAKVTRSDKETTNTIKATVTIAGKTKDVTLSVNTQPKLPLEYFLTGEVKISQLTAGSAAKIAALNEEKAQVEVTVLASAGVVENQGDIQIPASGSITITAPEGYILDKVEVDSNGNYNSLDYYTDSTKATRFDEGDEADKGWENLDYRTENGGRTLTTIPVNGESLYIFNCTEKYNAYSHWIKITLKKVATAA